MGTVHEEAQTPKALLYKQNNAVNYGLHQDTGTCDSQSSLFLHSNTFGLRRWQHHSTARP